MSPKSILLAGFIGSSSCHAASVCLSEIRYGNSGENLGESIEIYVSMDINIVHVITPNYEQGNFRVEASSNNTWASRESPIHHGDQHSIAFSFGVVGLQNSTEAVVLAGGGVLEQFLSH